jgi:high-affinity iron transporter
VARRSLLSLLGIALAIAVAGVVLAALDPWADDGSGPPKAAAHPTHLAPTASPKVTQGTIYGLHGSKAAFAANLHDEVPGPAGSSDLTVQQGDIAPLPVSAFRRPIARYRTYATGQARQMAGPVRRMVADLRAGHRAAAEDDWRAAYTRYLRLGAAYGALGDLDQAIDGEAGGLPRGVHDPGFSGLHRIERELWTGTPTARIVPWARRLQRDVTKLPQAIAALEITPLDYATRAHEILEDAQRDQLSGTAAPWSGDGVAATAAGLDATDRVMATLDTTLAGRESTQQAVATELVALRRSLDRVKSDHHGRYPRLDDLSTRERAQLDGALGATLEALALVPGTLETSRPPTIKAIP